MKRCPCEHTTCGFHVRWHFYLGRLGITWLRRRRLCLECLAIGYPHP